jgi:hypothetical protein
MLRTGSSALLRCVDGFLISDVSNKESAFLFEVWEVLDEGTLLVGLLNT